MVQIQAAKDENNALSKFVTTLMKESSTGNDKLFHVNVDFETNFLFLNLKLVSL